MKSLLAALFAVSLNGCASIMNDQATDVRVLSEPPGQSYTITNEGGERVRSGVTPDSVTLDAASGYFDGETYQVEYENGATVKLDSTVTPWFFMGIFVDGIFSLIIDPITGDMFTLPAYVEGGAK